MKESEKILKAIDGLIFERRGNTVSNHLKTWIKHDTDRFNGNITENKFEIWRYTVGAQGMHPVIFGEVIQEEVDTVIRLSPKPNPLGIYCWIFSMTILAVLTYFITAFKTDGSVLYIALHLSLLIFAPILLGRFVYRYETKAHVNQLIELIDKRTQKKQKYDAVFPEIF